MSASYEERLQAWVGRVIVPFKPGPDPVNAPMIRQWAEVMEYANPVFVDDEAARATGRAGIVAPAAMMQVWVMRGYAATVRPGDLRDGQAELVELLDEGGYTSVVATDSDFELLREIRPDEHIGAEEAVIAISPEKQTALGAGRFVTAVKTYRTEQGEVVATQTWRTLRFRPATPEPAPESLRPQPAINLDNAFWFDAARERRLVIQRCTDCDTLRHPPGPCCPHCGSFAWDAVEAGGGGRLYSWVVAHHPQHPAFDYPHIVALVELDEGTRLVTNLAGVSVDALEVGMPLVLDWVEDPDGLTLPIFRHAAAPQERGEL